MESNLAGLNRKSIAPDQEKFWISSGMAGFLYLAEAINRDGLTVFQTANVLLLITKLRGFDNKDKFKKALKVCLCHADENVRAVASNILISLLVRDDELQRKYMILLPDLAIAVERGVEGNTKDLFLQIRKSTG